MLFRISVPERNRKVDISFQLWASFKNLYVQSSVPGLSPTSPVRLSLSLSYISQPNLYAIGAEKKTADSQAATSFDISHDDDGYPRIPDLDTADLDIKDAQHLLTEYIICAWGMVLFPSPPFATYMVSFRQIYFVYRSECDCSLEVPPGS
jgi:hypothetical protein